VELTLLSGQRIESPVIGGCGLHFKDDILPVESMILKPAHPKRIVIPDHRMLSCYLFIYCLPKSIDLFLL
jgi:hypothetical protein